MSKKNRTTMIIIILFLFIGFFVIYIFNELLQENDQPEPNIEITDAINFKNEYEDINDYDSSTELKVLEIPDINPMKSITIEELIKKLDNQETFILYVGSPTSAWCRTMIMPMISTAKEMEISTIYYLSVKEIKSSYELDSKNKVVEIVEGSTQYKDLVNRFDNVLDYYPALAYKNKKGKLKYVKVDNKYIKEPSIFLINNGKAEMMVDGISDKQLYPNETIEKEVSDEAQQEIIDLFNKYKEAIKKD